MFKPTPKISAKEAAVNMLSRRDHAKFELAQKLQTKGYEANEITEALYACQEYGYLDDLSYAKSQVRQHIYKGHGRNRIVQVLKQNQVKAHWIEEALETEGTDWFELARQTARKKFKQIYLPTEPKLYAKQVRFLQYRGFDFEQIQYALQTLATEVA